MTHPSIPQLSPQDFFGTGVQKVNQALHEVLNVAETFRAADIDSGVGTPLVMAQGSSPTRWQLPEGVIGTINVLDHGMLLRQDQFAVDYDTHEVVLAYTPGTPYNISVIWSPSKGGFTVPVSLTQLGGNPQTWQLPDDVSVNVLVVDHGRLLRRDEYTVAGNVVTLSYTPSAPYAIAAAWGAGGPGIRPFQMAEPALSSMPEVFKLPEDAGRSITVTDHGFILSADDYIVDRLSKAIILNYTPADPNNIAVSWGYPIAGLFSTDLKVSPEPNGSNADFVLPILPVVDTLSVVEQRSDGTVRYHDAYKDYSVSGRLLKFKPTAIPAAGSTLTVSLMSMLGGNGLGGSGGGLAPDTLTKTVAMTPDGFITSIQYFDGAILVKSIDFTYNANGSLNTVTQLAGGKTFIQTFSYDAAGLWTGVTDTVL